MPTLFQINITANWGSTGKIAEAIGIAAMKAGWESYIAYGRWSNPSQSHLIKIGERFDKYFHYAEQRIFDDEGLCSRAATRKLILQIDEIKPDVVQLHNLHDHYLNYRILFEYLNQTDIKVVWTFHDCWAFTGHCFHFVTENCMKWQAGCNNCPLKNEYPKTVLDGSRRNYELKKALFTANKNLTIVPCSDWMAEFVRMSFLKEKPIEVIKNGVDLNVFKSDIGSIAHDSGNHKFKIIAVSNVWSKDKGLYDFFKLRDLLDKDKYEMIMIGLTKKQQKDLPGGIIGIERTSSILELAEYYSSADVFVNLTYADSFPTVNMEALACGTPVITYKTGGSPEIIDDQTGWVVKQGDVKLVSSIVEFINDVQSKDETETQRVACRKRAEEHFDKDKCFEKYIKLYDRLIIRK